MEHTQVESFTDLKSIIKLELERDDVNSKGSTDRYFVTCRFLIEKYANTESNLRELERIRRRYAAYNNHIKLEELVGLVDSFIVQQNLRGAQGKQQEHASFLRAHQEKFIHAISAAELDVGEFTRLDNPFILTYKTSGLYFKVLPSDAGYGYIRYAYTRYDPKRTVLDNFPNNTTINDATSAFESWLEKHVKRYVADTSYPDPWFSHFEQYATGASDKHFSESEIKIIEQKLEEYPSFLKQHFEIVEDKFERLIQGVDELKQELRKKSKRKWVFLFMGFVSDEVKDVLKDPSKLQQAWNYFKVFASQALEVFGQMPRMLP
jgi:hypothetical protein